MSPDALVLCLALATVGLSVLTGNALVLLASWLVRRGLWARVGARPAASLLVQARLAPLTLPLVIVPLVMLAFARYEPVHEAEEVGAVLAVLAAAGAWALTMAAVRGWTSVRATWRLAQAWRRIGVPAQVPGWQGRAWVIQSRFPVVAVVGLGRGELYVAEDVVRTCSPDEIAAIAAHERAHVSGRDNLTRVLFALAPAAGRAADVVERAWAATAEEMADLHARAAGNGVTLAQALTKVARLALGAAAPIPGPAAVSAFIGGGDFEGRVRRLLEPAQSPGRALLGLPLAALVPMALAAAIFALPEVHEVTEVLIRLGR